MTPAWVRSPARASGRRAAAPAFAACAALLGAFWLIALTAADGKGFTFDEPLHLVAAWAQAQTGDFRDDVEDPALWRRWPPLAMPADALRADTTSPTWARLPGFIPAGPTFAAGTLFRTPGADPARALRAARSAMVLLGVALGAVVAAGSASIPRKCSTSTTSAPTTPPPTASAASTSPAASRRARRWTRPTRRA